MTNYFNKMMNKNIVAVIVVASCFYLSACDDGAKPEGQPEQQQFVGDPVPRATPDLAASIAPAPSPNTECSQAPKFALKNSAAAVMGQFPAVGVLFGAVNNASGYKYSLCTATLICQNVVLTAAHCFEEAEKNKGIEASNFSFLSRASVLDLIAAQKTAPTSCSDDAISVTEIRIRDPESSRHFENADFALAKLSARMHQAPMQIAEERMAGTPDVTLIGYGANTVVAGAPAGIGVRRIGVMKLHGYQPFSAENKYSNMGSLWAADGNLASANGVNACSGDSGGPVIADGKIQGLIKGTAYIKDINTPSESADCLKSNVTLFSNTPDNAAWVSDVLKEWCK